MIDTGAGEATKVWTTGSRCLSPVGRPGEGESHWAESDVPVARRLAFANRGHEPREPTKADEPPHVQEQPHAIRLEELHPDMEFFSPS